MTSRRSTVAASVFLLVTISLSACAGTATSVGAGCPGSVTSKIAQLKSSDPSDFHYALGSPSDVEFPGHLAELDKACVVTATARPIGGGTVSRELAFVPGGAATLKQAIAGLAEAGYTTADDQSAVKTSYDKPDASGDGSWTVSADVEHSSPIAMVFGSLFGPDTVFIVHSANDLGSNG